MTGPELLSRDGEGRLEGPLGKLGEGLPDRRHRRGRVGRRQVERRDSHQPSAVGHPQGVVRRHVAAIGRDGPHELLAHPLPGAAGGVRGVDPVLRVTHEMVDEGGGSTEDGEDPRPRLARGEQRRAQRRDPPLGRGSVSAVISPSQGLEHADEREQCLVGVGCVTDRARHLVDLAVGGERAQRQQRRVGDKPAGPLGVGETEPGEGSGGARRARWHRGPVWSGQEAALTPRGGSPRL